MTRARYLYFEVDDSFAFDVDGALFTVTLTIAVSTPSGILVEYDNLDSAASVRQGAFAHAPAKGSFTPGAWHTVTVTLPKARFVNRTNGADFRVSAGGAHFWVAGVKVEKARS